MIPQFDAGQVEQAFRAVAVHLDGPLDAYLFGGGAMARMGAKIATRDVDISLKTEADRQAFGRALERSRAERQAVPAAPNPGSRLVWITPDRMGWDLFVDDVMGFKLTPDDYASSDLWFAAGDLSLHCMPGSFIFVMKAFTPRTRDLEDMFRLLSHGSAGVDDIVSIVRRRIGDDPYQPWVAFFYASVSELGDHHDVDVRWVEEFREPAESALVSTQILKSLENGPQPEEQLARSLSIEIDEIAESLSSLQRHAWVDVGPSGWAVTDRRRG